MKENNLYDDVIKFYFTLVIEVLLLMNLNLNINL